MAVLLSHTLDPYGLVVHHAHPAVDFFFQLSGFVVAYAYEADLKRGRTFIEFAAIRLVRLYPQILLGLALGFAVVCLKAWRRTILASCGAGPPR